MLKLEPKRGILRQIELGDSISKVLAHIQINFQIYGKIEIISTKENARNPIFLILPDTGIKLRFDHKFQCLELIELFYHQDQVKRRLPFQIKGQSINSLKTNYNSINHLMGPTYPARIQGNKVLLPYDCINFIFEYQSKEPLTQDNIINFDNNLVKINLSYIDEQEDQSFQGGKNQQLQHNLHQNKVKVLIDKGIQIYFPFNITKEPIIILFGDHLMDILRLLGNPNKEYHKDDNFFLNYLELGLDLMISSDYTLKKIIMHTNYPSDPYFGFHNRCFYEISIHQNDKDIEEEEKVKDNDTLYSNLDHFFEQNNKSKRNIPQTQQKDKKIVDDSSSLQHQQYITPFTKYSKIRQLMNDDNEDTQKDMFYVRNYNCGLKTHYYAYKNIIFEVMTDSDLIASVTLFKSQ